MTERPTTLEAALAWLAGRAGYLDFFDGGVLAYTIRDGVRSERIMFVNGDIPAAIVEAVGQVWDQVHGKDGAE